MDTRRADRQISGFHQLGGGTWGVMSRVKNGKRLLVLRLL